MTDLTTRGRIEQLKNHNDFLLDEVERLNGELERSREALHRCRSDMHAKVIGLQLRLREQAQEQR